MPIIVLNLEHRKDRAAHMREQLQHLGLPFEFSVGVFGEKLEPSEWALWVERIRHSRHHDLPLGRQRGSVGCLLSHRAAWEQLLACGAPYGLILEDDVLLSKDLKALLMDVVLLHDDADIIKLDTFDRRIRIGRPVPEIPQGRHLHPIVGDSLGGAAYILPRASLRPLLDLTHDRFEAIDEFLFDQSTAGRPNFNVLQLNPAAVIQSQHQTSLASSHGALASDIGRIAKRPAFALRWQSLFRWRWPLWNRIAPLFFQTWTTRIPFR